MVFTGLVTAMPAQPESQEVDELLLNARLRDELEPFLDESVHILDCRKLPTSDENEFLAQMLAWERAPVLPIAKWFEPELALPAPDQLSDQQVRTLLTETIQKLYSRRIVLDFTDHLSDRELYRLIYRDILPCAEKKIDSLSNYLHWDCADMGGDPSIWLRYYASEEERLMWADDLSDPLPPSEEPPYPRQLPRRPL
jgi:hypothetical protein